MAYERQPSYEVRTYFRDRDGNTTYARSYVSVDEGFSAALSYATGVVGPAMQALSNATWFKTEVLLRGVQSPLVTPALESTLIRKLVLLYRNDADELASIHIYSPIDNATLTGGLYDGVLANPLVLDDLTAALTLLEVTDEFGFLFSDNFVGGSLAF